MSRVACLTCPDYDVVADALTRGLELLGGVERFAARGEPVLVKPNLLAAKLPEAAVTTHPAVVEATLAALCDLGAKPVVADSPGIGSVEKVARATGIGAACARFDVPLLDLGRSELVTPGGKTYHAVELARDAVEAERVWNLPKWKTHTMMAMTLGVKNLYGCVPGKRKVAVHFRAGKDHTGFARLLLDIWRIVNPTLTILDGVTAMEGPGPNRGDPLARGLLLLSDHDPSLDWVATKLSGFDPDDVPTVRESLFQEELLPGEVELLGDDPAPLRFAPAPGSATDFLPLPPPFRRLLRDSLSPAPKFRKAYCTGCGICVEACPADALTPGTPPQIHTKTCIRCYCCQELCPTGAAFAPARMFGLGRLMTRGNPKAHR